LLEAEDSTPSRPPVNPLTANAEELSYASTHPPPESFDLVARTNADGDYVVNGQAYNLDGLVQLISELQAGNVLVEDDRSLGDGTLCLAVIGVETGAMLYERYDGKTTGLSIKFSKEVFDEFKSACRHRNGGNGVMGTE